VLSKSSSLRNYSCHLREIEADCWGARFWLHEL